MIMDITTFLETPDYFSLIMIFASGYLFTFLVWGKTRTWKEFDSTIKVVIALMVAFGIEFGLILPFFYLSPFNYSTIGLITPALEATWIIHWGITGTVALIITVANNRELALRYIDALSIILFLVFIAMSYVSIIILTEYYLIYPIAIVISTVLFNQFPIVFLFSILGIAFCTLFHLYCNKALEEEQLYGKASLNYYVKKEVSKFSQNLFHVTVLINKVYKVLAKKKFFLFFGGLVIAGLIIPIDNTLNIWTPSVKYETDIHDQNIGNYIDCSLVLIPTRSLPSITTSLARIKCDLYTINPGIYDQMNELTIPLDTQYQNKTIKMWSSFEPSNNELNNLVVTIPYKQMNILNPKLVPEKNPVAIHLNYGELKEESFNITMFSWEKVDDDASISISNAGTIKTAYNSTHNKWTQTFTLNNNYDDVIHLKTLQYILLEGPDIDRDSIKVTFNGITLPWVGINFNEINFFSNIKVDKSSSATLTIECITNKDFSF